MKSRFLIVAAALWAVLAAGPAPAETGHYVPGVEGIKGPSLPPPGFYYRMYNVFYSSERLNNANGDEAPVDLCLNVYAMGNRFLWVTDKEILGANYVADVLVPLVNTDIELKKLGVEDSDFGLGDIVIEPFILSWHKPQYDAVVAAGFYAPTGDYEADEPASPGKDFWSGLFTAGATWYLDQAKTWSVAALARYELNGEMDEKELTPGDDVVLEWGMAKNVAKFWDIGVAGYGTWQIEEDRGQGSTDDKDQAYGAGPEVLYFAQKYGLFASLRALWEFDVEDRPEGQVTTLTLTKAF